MQLQGQTKSRNSTGRKRGTVAVLDQLSPENQETLLGWFVNENIEYETARLRVNAKFGLDLKSIRPLFNWYHAHMDAPLAPPVLPTITLLDVTIDYHGQPLRIQVSTAPSAKEAK